MMKRPLPPVVLAPFYMALDWLTLNLQGPWANMPHTGGETREWRTDFGALVYTTQPYPTNTHTRVDIVKDADDNEVCTIASMPYGAHAHDTLWVRVKMANATLYTGAWFDVYRALRACGHEYRDIGQLDIATDAFAHDGGDFLEVVRRAQTGHGRYYGKGVWSVTYGRGRKREGMKPEGAELGRRSNGKFMRVYCKTRELKAKGHTKPWIPSAWCAALGGEVLADDVEVNRMEASLKCQEVKKYYPQSIDEGWLSSLHDTHRRRDIFASTAPTLFDFRQYADRARDAEPLAVWDWSRLGSVPPDIALREPKQYNVTEQAVKLAIHNAWKVSMAFSAPDIMERAIASAHSFSPKLVEWIERVRPNWFRAYAHTLKHGDAKTREYLTALSGRSLADMIADLDADYERTKHDCR